MEVNAKSDIVQNFGLSFGALTGQAPYEIYFRTGVAQAIRSIDTKKHGASNLIVSVTNQKTNTSSYAVRQIVSESYYRYFTYQSNLTTVLSNNNLVELDIINPVLSTSDEMLIQGQLNDFSQITTILLNVESPGTYVIQPSEVGSIAAIDNQNSIRAKLQGCIFADFDYKDDKTYNHKS